MGKIRQKFPFRKQLPLSYLTVPIIHYLMRLAFGQRNNLFTRKLAEFGQKIVKVFQELAGIRQQSGLMREPVLPRAFAAWHSRKRRESVAATTPLFSNLVRQPSMTKTSEDSNQCCRGGNYERRCAHKGLF